METHSISLRGSKADERDSLPQSRIVQTLHAARALALTFAFSLFKDNDAAASKCIRVYIRACIFGRLFENLKLPQRGGKAHPRSKKRGIYFTFVSISKKSLTRKLHKRLLDSNGEFAKMEHCEKPLTQTVLVQMQFLLRDISIFC